MIENDEEIEESITEEITDTEYVIDAVYMVTGVGVVTGGTMIKGHINVNSTLMLGPDKNGNFKSVIVKSIHENRVEV